MGRVTGRGLVLGTTMLVVLVLMILEGVVISFYNTSISGELAVSFIASNFLTFAFGALAGHWTGQRFKRPIWADYLTCAVILALAYWQFTPTFFIFLCGSMSGHIGGQMANLPTVKAGAGV